MEEVVAFDPKGKTYQWMLDPNTCFHLRAGRCSLTLKEEELQNYPDNGWPKASVHHCRKIYGSYLREGFREPIKVYDMGNDHYGFQDGQHRTCISLISKISSIPAIVQPWE
ncbi:hypothetical protein [Paenibacillus rubinfantis]|uniref:hypothetical protein n=1 Tax=Paenibacillus rubinfantis TaxID=1720296 RepID=UPI00073E597D|nr:hypothetical protein [Paenibacillus rubinfantis]